MEPQVEVVNAYLSGRDVVLLRRDGAGALHRSTVRPEYVAFLRASDVDGELGRQLSRSRFVRSYRPEGEWVRVGFVDAGIRDQMCQGRNHGEEPSPLMARGIATFEGDVSPVTRYLTDARARIQRPRRAYLDIETDSRVPFSRKEEMRILCWAVVDATGKRVRRVLAEDADGAERDLLGEMWLALEPYDQVLAWNGDGFDFPVLRARTEARAVRHDLDRWLYLDQMALFEKMNTAAESAAEKRSMKLDSIATALLGEGKQDFDASKTYEAWRAGGAERERMAVYCEHDTDLLRRIEEETGFALLLDTIADACRVFPDTRGLQPTRQLDAFMLGLGLDRGMHFPTRQYRESGEKFKGAYVMEPKARGIEKDVHVCDFSAFYPSIMLSLNMSPDTKALVPFNGPIPPGHSRSPHTGQGFRTGEEGILIHAIKVLIGLRKYWSDLKTSFPPGTPEWVAADRSSTAYKVAVNAFYGVVGSIFSRFYDRTIAESVTQTAVWVLKRVLRAAEERGMRPIYGDSDSLFIQNASRAEFEEFVRACNEAILPAAMAELGCAENHVKLAYEKQFGRIVFGGMKRYAGSYVHYKGKPAVAGSKPEIKGFEYKRGDSSLLAAALQERVIDRVIVEGDDQPDRCRRMVEEVLTRVLNDALPVDEVSIAKGVTKPLRDYVPKVKKDGTAAEVPVHVRVAQVLAARGEEVREGTRVAYVVTDGDGGINRVIPASDYAGEFDRYYLWESLVYPPVQRFLAAAFPDHDWDMGLARVRPPKLRGGGKVLDGQMGLWGGPPVGGPKPVSVPIPLPVTSARVRVTWAVDEAGRVRVLAQLGRAGLSPERWGALPASGVLVTEHIVASEEAFLVLLAAMGGQEDECVG